MKVVYWSDYACPFCYIGVTNLKNAIKSLGIENASFEMKAFELNPGFKSEPGKPVVSHLSEMYGETDDVILSRMQDIAEKGRAAGLDIHYEKAQSSNTFDAHRLTKMAQNSGDPEKTARLTESLYRAYFTDRLYLADRRVLTKIAAEAGFSALEASEVLNSEMFADEVRQDEAEAQMYGIRGVPYFVIDNRYAIPGALPAEAMISALEKTIG